MSSVNHSHHNDTNNQRFYFANFYGNIILCTYLPKINVVLYIHLNEINVKTINAT